jgi:hypothetical protein
MIVIKSVVLYLFLLKKQTSIAFHITYSLHQGSQDLLQLIHGFLIKTIILQ